MPRTSGFFIADCIALRIARRKLTRLESCSATPCATSWASLSGFLTSRMLSCTCLPVSFSRSVRIRSASAPLRPMTMPGRAVWMSTRTRSRVRSMSALAFSVVAFLAGAFFAAFLGSSAFGSSAFGSSTFGSSVFGSSVFGSSVGSVAAALAALFAFFAGTASTSVTVASAAVSSAAVASVTVASAAVALAAVAFLAAGAALAVPALGRRLVAGGTLSTAMVMWQVRLRIRYARPCARGRNRFSVGPSSTYASLTSNESGSSRSLFSALAMALASTLYTGSLAACGANCSTVSASFAGRPRTRLIMRRALVGEVRTYRAMARAPGSTGASAFVGIGSPLGFLYVLPAPALAVVLLVALERARQRELAELVPDHRLGHEHRYVLAPVVYRDRVPEHLGDDRGTT